jgi:hypothetical protein
VLGDVAGLKRVDVREHGSLSNRGSLATLQTRQSAQSQKAHARSASTHFSANRYFGPNFSNSANTQSVTVGIHFAIKQSIIPCTNSILFWIEKLIKLVSIRMRYGGPRAVLCDRKREAGRGVLQGFGLGLE